MHDKCFLVIKLNWYSLKNCPKINMWNIWKPLIAETVWCWQQIKVVLLHYQSIWTNKNIRFSLWIFYLLRNLIGTVLKILYLSPWDKSVLILKWLKQTQYWLDFNVKHFFVILKGVRIIHWQISHDFLIQQKFMHKNVFGQP